MKEKRKGKKEGDGEEGVEERRKEREGQDQCFSDPRFPRATKVVLLFPVLHMRYDN